MLRKTAVIAVLILIVSSFTLGSTVRIQAVDAGGSEGKAPEQFTQERGLKGGIEGYPPVAVITGGDQGQKVVRLVSQSYAEKMPEAADAALPALNLVGGGFVQMMTVYEGAAMPDSGFFGFAGLPVPGAEFSEGYARDVPDDRIRTVVANGDGYTTAVVNYSALEIVSWGQPELTFVPADGQQAGPSPGVIIGKGYPDGNMTIKGPVELYKPGAPPEIIDFFWKMRQHVQLAENGTFAVFSGHVKIPERHGGNGTDSPSGFVNSPAAGAIELSSDMVIDLEKLPVAGTADDGAGQTDDVYDNEIAAGQTNWHSASVGSAVKSVNVDLKWSDPDGKLRLMIYTPDGKVLGPYYDDADGKSDGRINLNIANPSSDVAAGEWHLKVTDMATLGNNDYYVRTY